MVEKLNLYILFAKNIDEDELTSMFGINRGLVILEVALFKVQKFIKATVIWCKLRIFVCENELVILWVTHC